MMSDATNSLGALSDGISIPSPPKRVGSFIMSRSTVDMAESQRVGMKVYAKMSSNGFR